MSLRPSRPFAFWVFASQFAALDAVFRGASGVGRAPVVLAAWAASTALWGSLATAAGRWGRRCVLALVAACVVAVELEVFRVYRVPLDGQLLASAWHAWGDLAPFIVDALPRTLSRVFALAAGEVALLVVAFPAPVLPGRWAHGGARVAAGLAVATAALAALPARAMTPDLALARAVPHALSTGNAVVVGVDAVRPLPSRPRLPRVLVVITESVRASAYCTTPTEPCSVAPETHALLPGRVSLRSLRSLASYTSLSLSTLLVGRPPLGPREDVLRAPSLFHIARAMTGPAGPPRTAYISAHTAAVFEERDVRSAADRFVTLESLLGHEVVDEEPEFFRDYDGLLARRFLAELPSLDGPAVVVLHFAGTHVPYFVDEARAPFQPSTKSVSWAAMPELYNAYRNAIFTQDTLVARCVRAFIARSADGPYLVLFTSDHGEAFGEHGAIHHGQSLFEEQTHVPGWIAWGNGALDDEQVLHLRAYAARPTTHLDLVPTVLDAMGVLDPYVGGRSGVLMGRSLLRAPETLEVPVPLSNCTALFPCPLDTWGLLDEHHLLEARPWDAGWNCWRLDEGGREELAPPGDGAACGRLVAASRRMFPTRPGGVPN